MELEEIISQHKGAKTFVFGDSERLSLRLLCQARRGLKTAMCGVLPVGHSAELLPRVGRKDIALNWDLTPSLLVETTDIFIRRFNEIDEVFAHADDTSVGFDQWREDHRAYFERIGNFSPNMKLICERFRVIEDFGTERQVRDCDRQVA
jgi:uncharacterized protein YhfF